MTTRKAGRDAGTGQFIPVREAERRKSTTVVEAAVQAFEVSRAPDAPLVGASV